LPPDWAAIGFGSPGLTFRADAEVKHGGRTSATIQNTGASGEPYNWRQNLAVNLPAGTPLRLTGWVKTRDAAWAGVAVQMLDAGGRMVAFQTTQDGQNLKGTADWKAFTLRFPVPKGMAHLAVLAMLSGRGQVWFDDFDLVVEKSPGP
jgi:hypothetical protein